MFDNPFAPRARYYARFRPGYPAALVDTIREVCGLAERSVVADVGAGTGISSELFLKAGYLLWAIEPCLEMRAEAEARLAGFANYTCLQGTAEALPLPEGSVDLVVVGQAFHWFQMESARREFRRVLRPPGYVALFWNSYRRDATAAMRAYQQKIARYLGPPRREQPVDLEAFYRHTYLSFEFENDQREDFATAYGGLLSHSRAPLPGDPQYDLLLLDLERWFTRYAESGQVLFPCRTELYIGSLDADLGWADRSGI